MSDRGALAAAQEETVQPVEQESAEPTEVANRQEVEQQGSEGAESTPETLAPALSQGEREKTAERLRQSEALPAGLRTRLAELMLAKDSAEAERAVRAVEDALPGVLRISGSEVSRPAHPSGDVFFHGDEHALSEEQAESIARSQLARSGLLRGQRVRVAE